MTQNRSSAVMQQRHDPADELNFFPTPPWATRALCEVVLPETGQYSPNQCVWEPACGRGDMARPLAEYFETVTASDCHDYGFGEVRDFLFPPSNYFASWVVTNPPFRLAEAFAFRALEVATIGVALLVRTAFLEGKDRYRTLWTKRAPTIIAQFVERVPMFKGRLDPGGSTATAYGWIVWSPASAPTRFFWIPPCRRRLERAGDYDGYPKPEAEGTLL